jgi:DNA primase
LNRGISSQIIEDFCIQYTHHITIPIFNKEGKIVFNKYRRNPFLTEGSKYWYQSGGTAQLYGLHKITDEHKKIVITESELCCLTLWSRNIPALSSTGGAKMFPAEWAEELKDKEVFLCFDNDPAGRMGMIKILRFLPQAKIIIIPTFSNVKDVTDFIKIGGDFHSLMLTAETFTDITEVNNNRNLNNARFIDTSFHDMWIEEYYKQKDLEKLKRPTKKTNDKLEKAKQIPISFLLKNKSTSIKCLFHNEGTPSMHIYSDNSFYCFGCAKYGSSVDIYMQQTGCTFIDAVNYLSNL